MNPGARPQGRGFGWLRSPGRLISATVAATMVVTLAGSVAPTITDVAASAELTPAERREQSLQNAPAADLEVPVPSEVLRAPVRPDPEPMPTDPAVAPEWPQPSVGVVDIDAGTVVDGPGRADESRAVITLADRATAPGGPADSRGQARVEILDRAMALRADVPGVLFRVEPLDSADTSLTVTVDYSGFADAYGGDWAARLQVVELPACAATTPNRPECQTREPLPTSNDTQTSLLSATVTSEGDEEPPLLGVVPAPSGPTGSWAATSLSPSAEWQVGQQNGDFTWSYPLRVPPAPGGPEPDLALVYSSSSVDGRWTSTNNQASWVGDGWDLTHGYVERRYVPCAEDLAVSANNAGLTVGDLCWSTDNANLVFSGHSSELVRDAATGVWRLKEDDGTRVEQLTGTGNGDDDGEYWKITTTDGTVYYFGRDQRFTGDTLDQGSAWTVPVFGNHDGEPCHAPAFGDSYCMQAWRWNLDYVEDTSHNTMTYVYTPETNKYGRNDSQAVSTYTAGGYLSRIEYGQRAGSEGQPAPAVVEFQVAERCIPATGVPCTSLTQETARYWPDVPFDRICTAASCGPEQETPTFFTRKRLVSVTTRVRVGDAYQDVDRWDLTQTFPATGDSTSPALWLSRIGHKGMVGSTSGLALPDVVLHGVPLPNRVPAAEQPTINRYRISSIDTEAGATISVNYTAPECSPSNLPTSTDNNALRCFAVKWTQPGTATVPEQESVAYFHKYLVTSVIADPRDGTSPAVETYYNYVGAPAWRYADSPLTPEQHRTWSDFRGYDTVDVVSGAPWEPQRGQVRYRYFRGMDGDHLDNGGTRAAAVDGITDADRLNGFLREEITYNGYGGPEVTGVRHWPWVSPPTATGADGTTATYLAESQSETRTTASSAPGGAIVTRITTTYEDAYGTPVTIDDQGDVTTAGDDRCTRLEYARNVSANLVQLVSRSETVSVSCAVAPARPGDLISDVRTAYDGGDVGEPPTRGLPTAVERVAEYTSGPEYVTEEARTYDSAGRLTSVSDALGRTTTTTYSPATGGPLTQTTAISPDPDGPGPLTPHVTVTTLNPAWGLPAQELDPNGKSTTATYDALGRITSVRLPGAPRANALYTYAVTGTGTNAVTTQSLTANEGYLTSVSLLDGLLRPRQSQAPSLSRENPGRLVTDTVYDTRGLVQFANAEWFTLGSPGTALVVPTIAVPARTRYSYDGAGRTTAEIFDVDQKERWRTTTAYDGNRVSTDPPEGAVAQTTIRDARGRTIELRQHTDGTTSGPYQSTTYTYDGADRLTGMTDPAGNQWTYGYDLRGRQVSASDPDKGATATTYDAVGQVTSVTDARGEVLAYAYDALGRRTELREDSLSGNVRASWSYDTLAKGQLTSSVRHVSGDDYALAVTGYDDNYRPLGQSVTLPASEGALAGTYTTSYTYAPNGQPLSVTHPAAGQLSAETVTTGYDSLSLPEWVSGGDGWGMYVASTRYSSFGDPLQQDLGTADSTWVNWAYEHGTRRLSRTWVTTDSTSDYSTDVTYTYDAAGNPLSITDRPTSGPGDAQCFAYDGLQRLIEAWTPEDADCSAAPSTSTLGGAAPYWFTDTFDPVGNRTLRVDHAAAGDTVRSYVYPAAGTPGAHRLVSVTSSGGRTGTSNYAYDDAGNTTAREVAGEPAQSLTWDAEGRLASITESSGSDSYLYTADGDRLVRRQEGATTIYLPGGQEVTLADGQVSAARYYAFDGRTVAVRTGTGASDVTTLVADEHGTAQLAVNNSSSAVTRRYTDPYGGPRGAAPGLWSGDRGYLDRPNDTSGLIAVGARYYDEMTGRFLSVDPVIDLADPQQWHAYAYSNNNPVTWSDATGLAVKKTEKKPKSGSSVAVAPPKAPVAKPPVSKAAVGKSPVKAVAPSAKMSHGKPVKPATKLDGDDGPNGNVDAYAVAETAGQMSLITGVASIVLDLSGLVTMGLNPQLGGTLLGWGTTMGWTSTAFSAVQLGAGLFAGDRTNIAEGALGTILGAVSGAWGGAMKTGLVMLANGPRFAAAMNTGQAILRTGILWLQGVRDDVDRPLISGPWLD